MSLNWDSPTETSTGKIILIINKSQMRASRNGDIRYHIDFGKTRNMDIYA
jgi:hypothetical protein